LPAVCNGMADPDCDDYPEDCDQLCCPCKPSSCTVCPVAGQVECSGQGCIDVASNDNACGACDNQCFGTQHCTNGVCQ
jgi:hypothetical protein